MADPSNASGTTDSRIASPAELVRIEADALLELAARLDGEQKTVFDAVAGMLTETTKAGHSVVLSGVGKSGLIARKIAATLVSTGTKAYFLHPGEALHGDLGLLTEGDVLIALSYSGETEELLRLLPSIRALGVHLVSLCGCGTASLAMASKHVLDVSVEREACTHQLAPTASTTVMLALGDALAVDVSQRLQFQPQHFADIHPGGQLGRRLATVRQLMHSGDALPAVSPQASMPELIHEMSAKRLGMTTVLAGEQLVGILSDGDLRRLLEHDGPAAFEKTASDVMNAHPRLIAPEAFASDALASMEANKITALVVTEDGSPLTRVVGVVHLHDLWEFAPKTGVSKPSAA